MKHIAKKANSAAVDHIVILSILPWVIMGVKVDVKRFSLIMTF